MCDKALKVGHMQRCTIMKYLCRKTSVSLKNVLQF